MDQLQEIIKRMKFICNQEGLTVSPDSILENSVRIYNTHIINKTSKEKQDQKDILEKPTEKQITFLKKLKLPIPKTKKEATILIKENINAHPQW